MRRRSPSIPTRSFTWTTTATITSITGTWSRFSSLPGRARLRRDSPALLRHTALVLPHVAGGLVGVLTSRAPAPPPCTFRWIWGTWDRKRSRRTLGDLLQHDVLRLRPSASPLKRGADRGGAPCTGAAARDDVMRWRELDYLAAVHHRYPVADVVRHSEVVGDEDYRDPEFLVEVFQEVQDPGPDAHIEHRDRFVGYDHLRLDHQRSSYGGALPLTTAELVRILPSISVGRVLP